MLDKQALESKLKEALPILINKILKEGCSSAKEEFSSLLFPYIIYLLDRHKNVIEPADTVSSTAGWIIFKILSKLDKIDLNKSVIGYISTITNNYCIDLFRKSRMKKRFYVKEELHSFIPGSSDVDLSVEFYIDSNFVKEDSEIIKLFFLHKKDYKEISELTGHTICKISKTIEDTKEIIYNEQFSI
jgi:DNA-directed RNA polymerase specialized sigma24 family protein